jgi:hypothetical protein
MFPKNSPFSNFGQGNFLKQLPQDAVKRFADFHGGHDSRQHTSQTPPSSSPRTRDMEVSSKNRLRRGPGVTNDETLVGHPAWQMALHASLDFTSELVMFDAPYIGVKGPAATVWTNVGLPVHVNPWTWTNFAGSLVFMNRVGVAYSRQPNSLTVEAHDTIPQGATLCVFAGRLYVGGAVLGGNLEPMGIAWSAANSDYRDFQSDGAGGEPLISDMAVADRMVCIRAMNLGLMAILNRRSIWVGTFTGDLFRPADFQPRVAGTGPINEAVCANTPLGVIFLGDQGVEVFDGNQIQHISGPIDADLLPIDFTETDGYSASYNIFTKRYTLHTPTQTWVFDLQYQRWYHSSIIATSSSLFPQQFTSETWAAVSGTWNDEVGTWADAIIREEDASDLFVLGTVAGVQTLGHLDYAAEAAFGVDIDGSWESPIERGSELNQLITTKGVQVEYIGSGTLEFWLPNSDGDMELLVRQQLAVAAALRTVWLPVIDTGLGLGLRLVILSGQIEVSMFELRAIARGPRIDTAPFYAREYYPDFDTSAEPADPADLPPGVPVPFLFIRADLMSDEQQGVPTVGPAYRLGSTNDLDVNDPAFDRTGAPEVVVFGTNDYVQWPAPVGGEQPMNEVFQNPAGFTLLVAADFTAPEIAAGVVHLVGLDSATGYQYAVVLRMIAGKPRIYVRDNAGGISHYTGNNVLAAGKRVLMFTYDPTIADGMLRSAIYVDGVSQAPVAHTAINGGAAQNNVLSSIEGSFVWGRMDYFSVDGDRVAARQFAVGCWKGIISGADALTISNWLDTLGW